MMDRRDFVENARIRNAIDRNQWSWLLLFTSSATLICCALPILLVSLGLGAVSASIFSKAPYLVTLANYKSWLFLGSGLMLVIGGWTLFRRGRACTTDPRLAAVCASAYMWNTRVWWSSLVVWGIGFAAAYLALPIMQFVEGG